MRKNKIRILHVAQAAGGVDRYIRMLLKYLDSEVTGKPLQERLYQYMSDASLSLSEMEPYFSYYPDKLYKNLVETRVIYNGILAQ